MAERIFSIGEIERSFSVSSEVEVTMKPRGFNTWCRLPYIRHPQGCPNFGVRADCPPKAEYFLDLYNPEVLVAALWFDFKKYIEKNRENHPDWTERALKNPRHFQRHLEADLKKHINSREGSILTEGRTPVYTGEAMGVNIHLTCSKAGINLEWPPKQNMYRIALVATPLNV